MKTTWLQFAEYNEYDNCIITDFEVPTDWLENQIEEPLEEFLDEYTTDESQPIYDLAVLHGNILNQKINKYSLQKLILLKRS